MSSFKIRPLVCLIISALLWPWLSFPAVNQSDLEAGSKESPGLSLEYYAELGENLADNPEELIKGAALGDWEKISARGLLIPYHLVVALHHAEMKRLGIEPKRKAAQKIFESKKLYVILMMPVKTMLQPCLDSAMIEFDDETRWRETDIYCDPYAQPDENWLENGVYWHSILMEFTGPLSEEFSGKLHIIKGGDEEVFTFQLKMPQKPEYEPGAIKSATQVTRDVWKKIRARYPDLAPGMKGVEIRPSETWKNYIWIRDDRIMINESALYGIGHDESVVAALILDCMNYYHSGRMMKVKTLEALEFTTVFLSAGAGMYAGIHYVDEWDIDPGSSLVDIIIISGMFAGALTGMFLATPYSKPLEKMETELEKDFTRNTTSRLMELGYNLWGYVLAFDYLNRYRLPSHEKARFLWLSYADREREMILIDHFSAENIPADAYWEIMENSRLNVANDFTRLLFLKNKENIFPPQEIYKIHAFSPPNLETEISSADPEKAPYIIIKYNQELRWMNNEQWRMVMKENDEENILFEEFR